MKNKTINFYIYFILVTFFINKFVTLIFLHISFFRICCNVLQDVILANVHKAFTVFVVREANGVYLRVH